MAVYVVIWVVCAIVGYAIGNPKGKGSTGLALGLILGVIGVIITIFLKDSPEVDARKHPIRQPSEYARFANQAQGAVGSGSAGWHPDPYLRHQSRYFDGAQWTANVATNGVQSTDPI
jgi:Protein of unknown function (DUF2510)